MSKTYVIVHGYNGSPLDHWQDNLYKSLQLNNEKVIFPKLPKADTPDKDSWIQALHHVITSIKDEIILVCHSLGSVLWLHYSNRYSNTNIKRVILVAPAGPSFIEEEKTISGFLPIPRDEERLKSVTSDILLISSQNDKYCAEDATKFFGKYLNLDTYITLPETGHINIESGFGRWDMFSEITGINAVVA